MMSSLYVDTSRLDERNRAGEYYSQLIDADRSELENDVKDICDQLREQGREKQIPELRRLIKEISDITSNMTDVCGFDHFALRKYRELALKIKDIVSSIDL